MSLDVYLIENQGDTEYLYHRNITHNLGRMADAAGIYEAVWRPEEIGLKIAGELAPLLKEGIAKMKADPEHFKQFNAKNGWGVYEHFLPWLEDYLAACEEHPNALIDVCR